MTSLQRTAMTLGSLAGLVLLLASLGEGQESAQAQNLRSAAKGRIRARHLELDGKSVVCNALFPEIKRAASGWHDVTLEAAFDEDTTVLGREPKTCRFAGPAATMTARSCSFPVDGRGVEAEVFCDRLSATRQSDTLKVEGGCKATVRKSVVECKVRFGLDLHLDIPKGAEP